MKSYSVLFFLCLSSCILATSDPATGHYLGKKPVDSWIATVSAKHNSDIQAAECSHNTRMSNQKFAWFQIDPSKVDQHESTYGTCYATTEAPSESQLEANSSYDVFFWQNSGGQSGVGTGPIRDPNNGEPGYEDNSGAFHTGNASDSSSTSGGGYKSSGGHNTGTATSGSGSDKDTTSGGGGSTGGTSSSTGTSGGSDSGATSSGTSTGGTRSGGSDTGSTSGSSGKNSSSHKGTHKHSHPGGTGNTGNNPYGAGNRKRFSLLL